MFGNPLPEIDVKTLADLLKTDEDFVLLDVREADELARAKIEDRRMIEIEVTGGGFKNT